jgi:hypothetical protein
MGKQGDCINIIRKDGKRVMIPLSIWEGGMKTDTDWRIENRPLLNTPEVNVVPIVIEKPVEVKPEVAPVEPPKVEPVADVEPKAEAPKVKREYRRKKKG